MSEIINLSNFEDLRSISDKDTCLTIYGKFVEMPDSYKGECFAQGILSGGFFLIHDARFPGKIVEAVASIIRPGEVELAMYEPHRVFNSKGELLKARGAVLRMLHEMKDASFGKLVYNRDGRKVLPVEMSLNQLVDLLRAEINPYFTKGIVAHA